MYESFDRLNLVVKPGRRDGLIGLGANMKLKLNSIPKEQDNPVAQDKVQCQILVGKVRSFGFMKGGRKEFLYAEQRSLRLLRASAAWNWLILVSHF
jgi:hypothetical protein